MVPSLVFGERVQDSTVLAAESTKKHTIDIMEHGDTEREPGRFLLASVKRIPNQDRRGVGLDRPKLTLTPLRTTFILVLLLTNGHALSAIRYELKYLLLNVQVILLAIKVYFFHASLFNVSVQG